MKVVQKTQKRNHDEVVNEFCDLGRPLLVASGAIEEFGENVIFC